AGAKKPSIGLTAPVAPELSSAEGWLQTDGHAASITSKSCPDPGGFVPGRRMANPIAAVQPANAEGPATSDATDRRYLAFTGGIGTTRGPIRFRCGGRSGSGPGENRLARASYSGAGTKNECRRHRTASPSPIGAATRGIAAFLRRR